MAAKSDTERSIKVKIDGEAAASLRRAARQAEAELRRVERENARIQKSFDDSAKKGADGVLAAFTGVTKGILAVGSAAGSAQGIAGATSALVTMSGAALAVPGILAAGAAAGGVFKLAMSGVGDAIAADDLEKFNKLTKDMAPNARNTAAAVRDQKDRLADLKKTVQGNFFEGFDKDVRQLGDRYFPILKARSGEIATEWNKMGREASKALLDPKSVREVDQVLSNSRKGMEELRPALANVVKGFLGISSVGSEKFPAVSKAVTSLTKDFDDWVRKGVESGQINDIIDEGIDTAKQFGRVLGNLGDTGRAVWRGLNSGEQDFLDGLEETTQMLEDFFESAEGQEVIRTLAEALRTTADVARNILATALRELGPVVKEVGPAVMELVKAVGESLVAALEFAGPKLKDTATFLSENKEVIGDLAPLVLALVAGYKGLSIAKDAAGWVGGLTGAFGDSSKKAGELDGAIGKGSKGGGGTGLIGSLGALGAIIGAGVVISVVNDSEIAKAHNFKIGLDDILATLDKIGKNGVLGAVSKYNDFVFDQAGKAVKGAQQGEVVLKISSDTSQAERNLNDLKDQVRRSQEFVTINGNRRTADQALADVLKAIDAGEGTVDVNGNTIDSQRALEDLIRQINSSTGVVNVDGNDVPAGQVLFGLLRTVTGSRATMSIDANTGAAQGVIDNFIRLNNGRTVQIYTSVLGSGGIASAGRLATGGPVRGPGSGTSDTAGLFALSNGEHVLTAAEVRAAGGHDAIMRLRRALTGGRITKLATGGPAVPAYLSRALPAPRALSPSVTVAAAEAPQVRVFIGDEEITSRVRTEIAAAKRQEERREATGPGGAW